MEPSYPDNVGGDLFPNNIANSTWVGSGLSLSLPANSPEQHLRDATQGIHGLAVSNTPTHTTLFPVSSSTLIDPTVSSIGPISSFQDDITSTQEMEAMDHWAGGASQYPGIDEAAFSPAGKSGARNMIFHTNRRVGNKVPPSPSQGVKGSSDLTSVGTWTHTLESFDAQGLGTSCLSRRKRLLVELRSRARGWHCPICYQPFKRPDFMKPHIKRKHPERYNDIYRTASSTPEPPVAAPGNYRSTYEDLLESGPVECEERRSSMVFWGPHLNNQATDSFQPGASPADSITHQENSLDLTSLDGRDLPGGFVNESPSSLKTSHNNWVRSLACPFYKHSPLQHRKCLALSLRRPKDVKQHIYRSHTPPEFYCARCYHVFHTATERDAHWRDKLCDRLDSSMLLKFQGITEDQKKSLNEKSPRDLSVERQWFHIYAIIFPGSLFPRSPYVGNWLEEMVPLLRQKWETQGYKITAQTVGDLSHHQLSFAMDLFFQSLEGEAVGHGDDDSSICAASAPSHMQVGDDEHRDAW